MNCRTCGALLQEAEAYCPQCGTTTLYSHPTSQSGFNETTVVSGASALVQPSSLAARYDSSSIQNPNIPSNITEPPPPRQRSSWTIGLVIGSILLAALLAGAGTYVWLGFSSPKKEFLMVRGTGTIVNSSTNSTQQDGDTQILLITEQAVSDGDMTGSITNVLTLVVRPDKTSTFTGNSTCTCTIAGKSGILKWAYAGTADADGNFSGQSFDIHGTGELAKLHGEGTFQGKGTHYTYSDQLYFDP